MHTQSPIAHITSMQHTLPLSITQLQKTKQWLSSLPFADMEKTCDLVLAALQQTQMQMQQEPLKSLKILELFHPVVNYLSHTMQTQYLLNTTIAPHKKRHINAVVQQLHLTYAQNLKITFPHLRSKEAEQQRTCFYAIYHLSQTLLRCYQLHHPNPAHIWQDIYQWYQTARLHQWCNLPISAIGSESPQYSINHLFKAAVLLGSCQPYQLHIKDKKDLYNHFIDWSPLVEIRDHITDDVMHVMELDGDEPPQYRQLLSDARLQNPKTIGLYNRSLIDILNAQAPSLSQKIDKDLPLVVRQHLLFVWTKFPTRSFPRIEDAGQLRATVGLASTHFQLNEQKAMDDSVSLTGTSGVNIDEDKLSETSREILKRMQSEEPSAAPSTDSPYQMHDWQLINSSAHGYCLCTTSDFPENIQVGEIIGVQPQTIEDHSYWHIGCIRWIRYSHDHMVQIGIHIIAANAIPVGIQKINHPGLQRKLRALLLAEEVNGQTTHSVITPGQLFQQGDKVRVSNTLIDNDLFLSKAVEKNQMYQQYNYKLLHAFSDQNN